MRLQGFPRNDTLFVIANPAQRDETLFFKKSL
jgi:hypothetical protein